MKFLVIGDVVGRSGLNKLKKELKQIIIDENIDFCIVNGENSASGKGLRVSEYNEILSYGADAITMGNHVYYRKEMAEEYIKLPRLLLPANITNLTGHGSLLIEKKGTKFGIINIIGKVEMGSIIESNCINPFEIVMNEVNKLKANGAEYIFVDFHAEATAEKIAMGFYLANDVNCMFGTHTHVQTADEKILDTGMAYITDVGMTGPTDSVLGLKKEIALKRFVDGAYAKYECSNNEAKLNGIIVQIDENTKKATSITRVIR